MFCPVWSEAAFTKHLSFFRGACIVLAALALSLAILARLTSQEK